MKRITLVLALSALVAVGTAGGVFYHKKHPDMDNIVSIQNSWLSDEEKTIALKRYTRVTCDDVFRAAFKEGILVVSNGTFDQFEEQKSAYFTSREMVISDMHTTYLGVYACTLPKDGSQGRMRVSLDPGVQEFLKK